MSIGARRYGGLGGCVGVLSAVRVSRPQYRSQVCECSQGHGTIVV